MRIRLGTSAALALASFAACFAAAAHAQEFPTKSIRVIIGFSAGSGGDVAVRAAAARAEKILGQPVVVENQGGAGGEIAAQNVARSRPDGYTLLVTTPSPLVTRQFLVRQPLPYDPVKDFTPITVLVKAVLSLVANPKFPANDVAGLIAYAKQHPGVPYGTNGVGSTFHMSAEQIQILTGIKLTHIPYKGISLAMNDLVAGQIPISFGALASTIRFAKSGKVKILAVIADERFEGLPHVQTLQEAIPGYKDVPAFLGVLGPAGLPGPIVKRLHDAWARAITAPEDRGRYMATGFQPSGMSPQAMGKMIREGIALTAKIVKAAGIKPR